MIHNLLLQEFKVQSSKLKVTKKKTPNSELQTPNSFPVEAVIAVYSGQRGLKVQI
jgi:hypothetical protein